MHVNILKYDRKSDGQTDNEEVITICQPAYKDDKK